MSFMDSENLKIPILFTSVGGRHTDDDDRVIFALSSSIFSSCCRVSSYFKSMKRSLTLFSSPCAGSRYNNFSQLF